MLSRLAAALRSLWRSLRGYSALDAEMSDEFRHHVELRARDLIAAGVPSAEAHRRARSARAPRAVRGNDLAGAATGKEWLTVLEAIYSRQEWPTWLLSRDIRLKFVSGQVFSAIPIAVKAVSEIRGLL